MDKFELLKKYKNLLDEGIIEQDEFDAKKKEILSMPEEEETAALEVSEAEEAGESEPEEAFEKAESEVEEAEEAEDPETEEEKRKKAVYEGAVRKAKKGTVKDVTEAINELRSLEDWQDAREIADKLQSALDESKKKEKEKKLDEMYQKAVQKYNSDRKPDIEAAITEFKSLGDWKDSKIMIEKCREKIRAKEEAKKKTVNNMKRLGIGLVIAVLIIVGIIMINNAMKPDLMDTGEMTNDTLHSMSFSHPESWTRYSDDEKSDFRRYTLEDDGEALAMIELYYAGESDLEGDAEEDDSHSISSVAKELFDDPSTSYDVIYADDSAFEVTVYYKEGEVKNPSGLLDTIIDSMDTDKYENPRKLIKTEIEYSGSTKAGVEIKKDDIKITETYDTGKAKGTRVNNDFKIKDKVVLKAGETSTVKIDAGGKEQTLKITCTTITEAQYKAKCKSRNYKNQLRKASYGKYITIYGQVLQDCGYGMYRISSSGGYDNVYMVKATDSDIVEDDWVTVYGETDGIYEYETVMGASQKIPSIDAKYIDR